MSGSALVHLTERSPQVSGAEMVASLVPPPQFDAATEELLVPVLSADVDPASIIADAGLRGPLFGAPQKSPETSLVRIPLLGGAEDGVAAGALVTLTFDTPRGPFNMVHEVLAAGSTPANP